MASFIRRKVSQNRKRLNCDNYDLDMTYICENIIAMGVPVQSLISSVARNPLEQVVRYLKEKHGNSFKVYDLLRNPKYNYLLFQNMVESYPMDDHYPPNFTQIEPFCRSVHDWVTRDKKNVAVVHCKAGKGRTGTMISCYFLYSNLYNNPFDAMRYFSTKRCIDEKGVTIPSQRRYVEYFADYLFNKRVYTPVNLYITQIDLSLPNNSNIKTLSFKVFKESSIKLYDSEEIKLSLKKNETSLRISNPICVYGDIKVAFMNKRLRNKRCIFNVTFNTFCLLQDNQYAKYDESCLGQVTINDIDDEITWTVKRKDIDIAHKSNMFAPEMKLVFHFQRNPNFTKCKNEQEEIKFRNSDSKVIVNEAKPEKLNELNAFENMQINDEIDENNDFIVSRSASYVSSVKPMTLDVITENNKNLTEDKSSSDSKINHVNASNESIRSESYVKAMKSDVNENEDEKSEDDEEDEDDESGSLHRKEKRRLFSFFKRNKFFSQRSKKNKCKHKRKQSSSKENSQNYDLLSNSSNKMLSTNNEDSGDMSLINNNNEKQDSNNLKTSNTITTTITNSNNNKSNNLSNESIDLKQESNIKSFFTRRKPNQYKID